jgi:hypothetical protein
VPVNSPAYVTREELMLALDFHPGQREITLVDRAIQAATNDVYGILHRQFYPEDGTRYFDWPNYSGAAWNRIWLEENELARKDNAVVTSGGNVIPAGQILWRGAGSPGWSDKPPFVAVELALSSSATFGQGLTPQRDVAITGTYGFGADTAPAGILTAAIADSTSTGVSVSDASLVGVGDLLTIGTERMIVSDRAMASTGVTFDGPATANANDQLINVPDVTKFALGEVLLLDAERMYVTDIAGSNLVVKRGWAGTVLSGHTSGTIYAARQLSVIRGATGTTAASHPINAPVSKNLPPALVTELALALAENSVLQKTSGYARTIGPPESLRNASGAGLADIIARATAQYGRSARIGVI